MFSSAKDVAGFPWRRRGRLASSAPLSDVGTLELSACLGWPEFAVSGFVVSALESPGFVVAAGADEFGVVPGAPGELDPDGLDPGAFDPDGFEAG